MIASRSTMGGMASKKTSTPRSTKTHPVYATLPRELVEALERYRAEQRPVPDKSGVIAVALEDFLQSKGYWPPPR